MTSTVFYKGARTEEEKDRVNGILARSLPGLELLAEVLKDRLDLVVPSNDYDTSGNWAYKQADRNGYNRAIEHTIALIKSISINRE